ncbi:MAG: tRNA (guanosine(46)-N7)-methyltransferase TrmB [Candidatus Dojkabacteria bacterium]
MKLSKLEKFKEFSSFPNSLEYTDASLNCQIEKWFLDFETVILELGCGKGDYALELAKRYPNILFIGIDIQGERLWRGAKNALEEKIDNARFLRCYIDHIDKIIPGKSVHEIWITFPDPFPKDKRAKKRLTHNNFLEKYRVILKDRGLLHLKTDDEGLFNFSTNQIKASKFFNIRNAIKDIYNTNLESLENRDDVESIQTTFEKKWLNKGSKINYLCAALD